MGIVSVVLIGFLPNPRIYKRLQIEKTFGETHLICWDRGKSMLLPPQEDGFQAHVLKVRAGGDPVRRLIPYRKFALRAMALLKQLKPGLIHVQGLDMLKIACNYKCKYDSGVRIIYEVPDLHRLLVDKQQGLVRKAAQWYLVREDRKLASVYDLLIVTSWKYYESYFRKFLSEEKTLYMPNVPDLSAFDHYIKKNRHGEFTVGYIGSVRYKQQMKNLVEAADASNIHLMIAGFEDEPVVIEPMCRDRSNVEWFGRFDFKSQAADLYSKCDVMYSVYNADMANVRVALPNKLYESVWCEMPLIVAKNTYLADLTREWGVGVAVDHKEAEDLRRTLERLRDDLEYYNGFVEKCKQRKEEIDLKKYNAQFREKLLELTNGVKN